MEKYKNFIIVLSTIVLFWFSNGLAAASSINTKVDRLLKKMTLEEKAGQMTQLTMGFFMKKKGDGSVSREVDTLKLKEGITKYHIGSILNVPYGFALSANEWHALLKLIQDIALKETRLGIPVIYGIDAVHGATYTKGATIFPQNIGMAATFDSEIARRAGEITAFEIRACGLPWNFSPVLGVGRQPLWSRFYETFGEDPYLVSRMGEAVIKGYEGGNNRIGQKDRAAACMKHYIGYSIPLSGKDRTPAWIPENKLREYCLPSFRAGVNAGAHTVMINSNEVNGTPLHADHYWLTRVLQKELGFKGVVLSDWEDINRLHQDHRVAATVKEAVRMAVMAGIDMSMVPNEYSFQPLLVELVKEGKVPVTRINAAVRKILRLKFELGLFERPYPDSSLKSRIGCGEFSEANRRAARESITLLKNDGRLLPLKKNVKALVTGPAANSLPRLCGGWTVSWQGDDTANYPRDKMTILQAVQKVLGKKNVLHAPGATGDGKADINRAVAAAKKADVVLFCAGERPYAERPGIIPDLTLPEPQLRLAEALENTGKPVVLILVEGRPRIINRIADKAGAILMCYLPGMEGGGAVADILFGDANPCGKLPFTYPRTVNDFTLYDHRYSEEQPDKGVAFNPQFPFGSGLSYTTFQYSDLKLDKTVLKAGAGLHVKVTVKNTGKAPGRESVLLYVSDLYASLTPSVKKLKRFSKVSLAPGQAKTVTFRLGRDDWSFIGRDNKPVVEPGEFSVTIDTLSATFTLK